MANADRSGADGFQAACRSAGGFAREAVQVRIVGATLSQLALVDKSLLRYIQDDAGQGRYEIHELLRQFAAEKLQQIANEQNTIQERHAAFYTAWLGSLEKVIVSGRRSRSWTQLPLTSLMSAPVGSGRHNGARSQLSTGHC